MDDPEHVATDLASFLQLPEPDQKALEHLRSTIRPARQLDDARGESGRWMRLALAVHELIVTKPELAGPLLEGLHEGWLAERERMAATQSLERSARNEREGLKAQKQALETQKQALETRLSDLEDRHAKELDRIRREDLSQLHERAASWARFARTIERSRTWRIGNFIMRVLRLLTFRRPASSTGPGELAATIEATAPGGDQPPAMKVQFGEGDITPRPHVSEDHDPTSLRPGDPHYMAYVGPPDQYDFMGATQFSLLFALGLRGHHRVLDFGCGSLRAGRLLIPYLQRGSYFGVEPNRWLIEEAVRNEIGDDLIRTKQPTFDHNDHFEADCFDVKFDFILAQSIFSHTGPKAIRRALQSFRHALRSDGLIVATFIEGENDYEGADAWVYPQTVSYTRPAIEHFASQASLACVRIPWFHPRQTWYLLAAAGERLPSEDVLPFLRGAVLFDPEFADSVPSNG